MKHKININSLSVYPFKYDRIIVGFSGGADSTALLLLLKKASENCSNTNFRLEAVHFEHGIRGNASLQDAQWCSTFCEKLNIPIKVISLNLSENSSNLEAEARYRRLNYWIKNAAGEKTAVALGHHLDDKAENFFLRLMRGGNSSSLTSLRDEKIIHGINFIRPLLSFSKSEIENFLVSMGINNWRTDESNTDLKHKRNLIRHKILPLLRDEFPAADNAINKSLFALQTDADFIEKSAFEKFKEIEHEGNIKISWFGELHNALLIRVLRYWISKHIKIEFIPNYDFICRFEYMLKQYSASKSSDASRKIIQLPDNFSIVFQKESVSISENIETVAIKLDSIIWTWKKNKQIVFDNLKFTAEVLTSPTEKEVSSSDKFTAYFNLNLCPDEFIIRRRKPGDKMIPFNARSEVSVKKLLENAKITGEAKQKAVILTSPDADTVIWIPGVKRSSFAPALISDHSESDNILKLTATPI